MRKKIMIYILMAVGTLFLLTGCKKNVGTPEDNAVTDESDDKKEDTDQEKKVIGSGQNIQLQKHPRRSRLPLR